MEKLIEKTMFSFMLDKKTKRLMEELKKVSGLSLSHQSRFFIQTGIHSWSDEQQTQKGGVAAKEQKLSE